MAQETYSKKEKHCYYLECATVLEALSGNAGGRVTMGDKILKVLDHRIAELQAKVCEDRAEGRMTSGLIEVFVTLRAMIAADQSSGVHPSLFGVEPIREAQRPEGRPRTHESPKRVQ